MSLVEKNHLIMEELTKHYIQSIEAFSDTLIQKEKKIAKLRLKIRTIKKKVKDYPVFIVTMLTGEGAETKAKSTQHDTQNYAVDFILYSVGLRPKGKNDQEQILINQVVYDLTHNKCFFDEKTSTTYTMAGYSTDLSLHRQERRWDPRIERMRHLKSRPCFSEEDEENE